MSVLTKTHVTMAKKKAKTTKKAVAEKTVTVRGIEIPESEISETVARYKTSPHATRHGDDDLRAMAISELYRKKNANI